MRFIWDPSKARLNLEKHDVTFEEAASCFADELALEIADAVHAERLMLIGASTRSRLLFVVHAVLETDDAIRIISARKATRNERRRYEEGPT